MRSVLLPGETHEQRIKRLHHASQARYYNKHKDKIQKKQAEYRKAYPERISANSRKSRLKRAEINPLLSLKNTLRGSIRRAILGNAGAKSNNVKGKLLSSYELMGCSVQHARWFIENRFLPGMTWENRGEKGWHIDHVKPCAAFDLSDEEEQRRCFHFSNLQPLWAMDNYKKGSQWPI